MKDKSSRPIPFLKWAGGKRWFVVNHGDLLPTTYHRYFEPFLGSGALFFHLCPKRACLTDLNSALISTYQAIRDDWLLVQRILESHQLLHSDNYYYFVRQQSYRSRFHRAAQFIYLNRTCWNGLYRVNMQGSFNVPRGTKNNVILDTDNFQLISELLHFSIIETCDFEESIEEAGCDDFIFVDPPYTVNHNFNGFIKYNEKLFSWADQVRLRDALLRAVSRGAKVVATNANHQSVQDLYRDFPMQLVVPRESVLSGSAAHRSSVEELVIRSW